MSDGSLVDFPTEGTSFRSVPADVSVFINCPFDDDYKPLMDAIVFATVCCGFIPRSAMESGSVAVSRIERICAALLASKYSIHDLTRCRGEGSEGFARFNMPLELGVAMAKRFLSAGEPEHDWLVLVPEGHAYVRFVSDLAGYDPKEHQATPETVIPAVMSWLCTRPEAAVAHNPSDVLAALPRFVAAREQLDLEWGNQAPWAEIIAQARYAMPA